jgi:hypothetical protein
VALREGMRAGVAALGLAATDMAAGGAEPEVEPAPAFLASLGLWLRGPIRHVITLRRGTGKPAKNVHVRTVPLADRVDCVMAHVRAATSRIRAITALHS